MSFLVPKLHFSTFKFKDRYCTHKKEKASQSLEKLFFVKRSGRDSFLGLDREMGKGCPQETKPQPTALSIVFSFIYNNK